MKKPPTYTPEGKRTGSPFRWSTLSINRHLDTGVLPGSASRSTAQTTFACTARRYSTFLAIILALLSAVAILEMKSNSGALRRRRILKARLTMEMEDTQNRSPSFSSSLSSPDRYFRLCDVLRYERQGQASPSSDWGLLSARSSRLRSQHNLTVAPGQTLNGPSRLQTE